MENTATDFDINEKFTISSAGGFSNTLVGRNWFKIITSEKDFSGKHHASCDLDSRLVG
jgi:hypothetical protein